MRVQAITADITTLEVDAIVNAANSAMIIGGGVDGAIHKAAGPELINYNARQHGFGCPTGAVKVTPGFDLPAKYILHTVGPDMRIYSQTLGDTLLAFCYYNCMKTAITEGLESIAFPAISTGIFGFDKARAAKIAAETVFSFSGEDGNMDITFACFTEEDAVIINTALDVLDEEIHHISWSVGSTHYPEGPNGEYIDDAEQILDLDTDAPDGVYDVIYLWVDDAPEGKAHGVTVKDGKFVLEPTLRACAIARNMTGYWGHFLEGLNFYPEDDTAAFFEAQFGS